MSLDATQIPRAELAAALKEYEEDVLYGLRADIFSLVASYRLACRGIVSTGRPTPYRDLPDRLKTGDGNSGRSRCHAIVTGQVYATVCRRTLSLLPIIAEAQLQLVPPARELFADVNLERQRRLVIYARQVEAMDRMAAEKPVESPMTKPVYCVELAKWFQSGAEAARYISRPRKDVRTALVRNCRCAGLHFTYDGPAETRPTPTIVLCPSARPMQSADGRKFRSIAQAAKASGIAHNTLWNRVAAGNSQFSYV